MLSKFRVLLKPFMFTAAFSVTSFTCCAVWETEAMRKHVRANNWWPTSNSRHQKTDAFMTRIAEWYNTRSESFKIFASIALINGIVFICWKVRPLQNFMLTHFMTYSNTKSIRCLPMILSSFSHNSFTHLFFNMVVLYSFTDIGVYLFGKQQFIALYLSSGVISSFASHFYKIIALRQSLSLGASGAILGILASCCVLLPEQQLMIIFLPFFTFSAATGLKLILLLDASGIIFKWRFFDHAAHLGGALFGIWYAKYGEKLTLSYRKEVTKHWRQYRSK